jgi:hypothetical protein
MKREYRLFTGRPEKRDVVRLQSSRSKDWPHFCAGSRLRFGIRAESRLEIGDTAGLETCATAMLGFSEQSIKELQAIFRACIRRPVAPTILG